MTQPTLPWHGRSPHARQAGYDGARVAARARGRLQARYLDLLREAGPLTDYEAAERLACPRSSICSTRAALADRGLVRSAGLVNGPFRARNATYEVV